MVTFEIRPDGSLCVISGGLQVALVDPHTTFVLSAKVIAMRALAHEQAGRQGSSMSILDPNGGPIVIGG